MNKEKILEIENKLLKQKLKKLVKLAKSRKGICITSEEILKCID